MNKYSYCESITATSISKWHIRKLTEIGQKLSGGIDTPSFCGHVKAHYGWDIKTPIDNRNIESACPICASAYKREPNV